MAPQHVGLSNERVKRQQQLAFRNVSKGECYYWPKNISGKIVFFQNYCQTIFPMPMRTFFSENDDFVREKLCCEKKIQWKWNKLRGKWQYFKCGGNHKGKGRHNAEFRTIYWKSRSEPKSIGHNKSVINNITLLGDNFFEMLCKETNLYYF
jgi:hypothetical protein